MADEEVKVKFGASNEELKAKAKESEEVVGQFKEAAEELGKMLLEVFALEKIREFTKEAVLDFARFERSMDTLGAKVRQQGGDWASLKGPLDEYIERIELTTRFNDIELSESISKLTTLTGSFTQAIRINKLAMDFSVGTNMDLATASRTLGLAAEGNTRGLSQMARAMGVTGEEAKNANYLFAQAEQRFKGMAEGEHNTATALDRASHAVANLSKAFGEQLAPSVIYVADKVAKLVQLLGLAEDHSADAMKEQAEETHQKNLEIIRLKYGQQYGAQLTERQQKQMFMEKTYADDQYAADLKHANQRRELAEKGEKLFKEMEDGKIDTHKAGLDERLKDLQKEQAAEAAEIVKMNDYLTQKWNESALQIEGQLGSMVVAMKQAADAGASIFEALAKSVAKFMINAFADILEQDAIKNLVMASSVAANPFTFLMSGAMFSSAGAELAAAGVMKGVAAAFLADGGYVNQPTLAVIGEDGPEKVVPLSKGHPMDQGGGMVMHNTFNYQGPGGQQESNRFGESSALSLQRKLDELGWRTGTGLQTA